MGLPKVNSQDHEDRETIPDKVCKIETKKIEKLPEILKKGVINLLSNKASKNIWRCTGIVFITCKDYKIFQSVHDFHVLQTVYCSILCSNGEMQTATFEHIILSCF